MEFPSALKKSPTEPAWAEDTLRTATMANPAKSFLTAKVIKWRGLWLRQRVYSRIA
jgi:hypothetical protein